MPKKTNTLDQANKLTRTGRKRIRVSINLSADSRTKQSFKDECDVNQIMARYKRTGVIEHLATNPPLYGDFDNSIDYQAARNAVIAAEDAFNALPAHIRDRMDNNPGNFMSFMEDPANTEEAIELGLLTEKPSDPSTAPIDTVPGRAQPPEEPQVPLSPPQPPNPTPNS